MTDVLTELDWIQEAMANAIAAKAVDDPSSLFTALAFPGPSWATATTTTIDSIPQQPSPPTDSPCSDTFYASSSTTSPRVSDESDAPFQTTSSSQSTKRPSSVIATDERPLKIKQKRRGRVISELRKESKTSSEPAVKSVIIGSALGKFNLGPSSSAARISSVELAASLGWHLVSLSNSELGQFARHIPLRDLRVASRHLWLNLRNTNSPASRPPSRMDEVIFACLSAIGARRSTHSAILGFDGGAASLTATLDEVVKLQLGIRREQACRRLVEIAIQKIEASGLLEEDSPEAYDAFTMVRMMLFGMYPSHPYVGRVIELMKRHAIAGTREEPRMSQTRRTDQVLIFDSFYAASSGAPLSVSDAEIEAFGWGSCKLGEAFGEEPLPKLRTQFLTLSDDSEADVEPSTTVGGGDGDLKLDAAPMWRPMTRSMTMTVVAIHRELVRLRIQDTNQRPLHEVIPILERMLTELDECMTTVIMKQDNKSLLLPHVLMIPHVVLSTLVAETTRRCRGKFEPNARTFLDRVQAQYLWWLHHFSRLIAMIPPYSVLMHTRALMLIKLDLLQGWVEIAVNGATQHALGVGPLAHAGFTFDDFKVLHECFKEATRLYASSTKREDDIARALAALALDQDGGLGIEEGSSSSAAYCAAGSLNETEMVVGDALKDMMSGL